MSDGPHRSLPLRRHWKDFAERCAKAAYSAGEVREALPYALKREILEAPIKEVRSIFNNDTLFPELRQESFDELRRACRGSAAATRLIDCAVEALSNGLTGDEATHSALKNAAEDTALACLRATEEHYQREAGPRSAGFVRTRLDDARRGLDCGAIASDLLSAASPPARRTVTLPRHNGVDDGPAR